MHGPLNIKRHNLWSIRFMRQNMTIEISKDFLLVIRIFDQEQMLMC